jgi:hypothetical protein
MSAPVPPVILHMQSVIQDWERQSDPRSIFLNCYCLMTGNMLTAIDQNQFKDPAWVDRLLHSFADYYFIALDHYNCSPTSAPLVWQLAHNASFEPGVTPLQKLLLGVNAHINYDLVLTLVDLLKPEWQEITEGRRIIRYKDHCMVNDVIASTIDAVQDDILEPAMPVMDIFDKLLGPLDELIISRLIARWRENVWKYSVGILNSGHPAEQAALLNKVEAESLRIGRFIRGPQPVTKKG